MSLKPGATDTAAAPRYVADLDDWVSLIWAPDPRVASSEQFVENQARLADCVWMLDRYLADPQVGLAVSERARPIHAAATQRLLDMDRIAQREPLRIEELVAFATWEQQALFNQLDELISAAQEDQARRVLAEAKRREEAANVAKLNTLARAAEAEALARMAAVFAQDQRDEAPQSASSARGAAVVSGTKPLPMTANTWANSKVPDWLLFPAGLSVLAVLALAGLMGPTIASRSTDSSGGPQAPSEEGASKTEHLVGAVPAPVVAPLLQAPSRPTEFGAIPPESPAAVRTEGSDDWIGQLSAATCPATCVAGALCPAAPKKCPSGATCLVGPGTHPLGASEHFRLHLTFVEEQVKLKSDGTPYENVCATDRDLWVCMKPGDSADWTCVSQRGACRNYGNQGRKIAWSSESIEVTAATLTEEGVSLRLWDGAPGQGGTIISDSDRFRIPTPTRAQACDGVRFDVNTETVKRFVFLLLPTR